MSTVTVVAPDGVTVNVRKQLLTQKASIINTQGFDENGNPALTTAFGPKVTTWPDQSIDTFASDKRDYVIDANNRIVVEFVSEVAAPAAPAAPATTS